MWTVVNEFMALCLKMLNNHCLEVEASMVTTDMNSHGDIF